MSVLTDGIEAANQRKLAMGLFDSDTDESMIVYSESEFANRSAFAGFDIDYEELCSTVANVGMFFLSQTAHSDLPTLFQSAWVDGLLIGLMIGKNVAPHHEPPDPGLSSSPGSGGDSGGDK